jgi:hypothetical protein
MMILAANRGSHVGQNLIAENDAAGSLSAVQK